jgi:GR25 family glycosyltransferase involved in LPS biosynthesis
MKVFVINLSHRRDRLGVVHKQLGGIEWERFEALNGKNLGFDDFKKLGYTPFTKWVDPILERRLTGGEIACAISHYRVWLECLRINEPVLILEDDIELLDQPNFKEVEGLLKTYDVVYLDHREMYEEHTREVDDKFFVPYYPYWNSAYAISPSTAKKITSVGFIDSIIPIDEFFPLIYNVDYSKYCLCKKNHIKNNFLELKTKFGLQLKPIAYKQKVFKQQPRKILGSDIESGKIMNPNESMNVHVVTVGTDESRTELFAKSANHFNINFTNLGKDVQWNGGNMKGPGGGQKINLVKKYILDKSDTDIVLFCDGYDVIINDDLPTIVERFLGFECNVLIAAEKTCWPDEKISGFFESETQYKYPNSGLYIGYVKQLKELFGGYIQDSDDDQFYLQMSYLKNKQSSNVKLDVENYLFQCFAGAEDDLIIKSNLQLLNNNTRCCPCIIHGNGSEKVKLTFDNFMKPITSQYNTNIITYKNISTKDYKPVAQDIIETEFLSEEMCKKLIDIAESHGKWESLYGDKFPGQELRIREISVGLFEELEKALTKTFYPIIESYWRPTQMYGLRDAFIIKYSPETQSSLACHNDASMVSGIIKLNDEYEGGDTYFYRQNFSNINTTVGNAIWWPGQVTHGHEGRKILSGTKYSLVLWTSRMKGDINY